MAIRPRNQGRDYFRIVRCIRHLHDILYRQSFDLVHTHGYFADIIGVPVCKFLKIPHMSTCHGFILGDRNLKIYNALDRFALRFCNRIIAVSEGIRDDLVKSGNDEAKIVGVENAVKKSYDCDSPLENRLNKRNMLRIKEN